MIPYSWLYLPAIGIRHDEIGLLPGHVAVDAVARDLTSPLGKDPTAFNLVAGKTALRKCGEIMLS
jgi:hypothetical protein